MDREADRNDTARDMFNALSPTYRFVLGKHVKPLRFPDARAFAAIAGIRLHDVLLGRCVGQTRTIDYRWGLGIRDEWHTEKRKRRSLETVRAALDKELQDERSARSLTDIAKSIDVSVGYLNYRFPGTAKRITKRFQSVRAFKTVSDKALARREAIRFFKTYEVTDAALSRKAALRELRGSTRLAKHLLRREIADVYQLLHR